MIRCVAVDDEPKALEVIQRHASRSSVLNLEQTFTDPFEAIEYVNSQAIELVFLDINMPDINGLQLVEHFRHKPLVVFTTAHSAYAIESYQVEAIDYLLKPFDYARFLKAVSRAEERLKALSRSSPPFLFINTGNQKQRIMLDALLYIESEGNYVSYATKTAKHLVRASIRDTLTTLPADQFVQIHRSYIVALQAIDRIEDNRVFIADRMLPIGATYREGFSRRIDGLNG